MMPRSFGRLVPATGRGRSSGVEHNLAKVGVEGSNPFARSRILQNINALEEVVRGESRTSSVR
jgi:hypothetical protein